MSEERIRGSQGRLSSQPPLEQAVERVDPKDLDTVARILAVAYAEYPIHAWAMPKAATRQADATTFFTFYLRWMQRHSWDVFTTADRLAVLVMRPVRYNTSCSDNIRNLPTLVQTKSPVNEFFRWIETFRPKVDHEYSEFLGCMPQARRGSGFFLLASVLKMFDRECLPVWSWTSNPLNLPFYRRLGFEIGAELRRDDSTPPVTPMWRPPMPFSNEEKKYE
ncbi:MAG: hypothetical protein ABSA46_07220 [Thermodesulfovibrionales bacterium]|jgi:hypothetical protein